MQWWNRIRMERSWGTSVIGVVCRIARIPCTRAQLELITPRMRRADPPDLDWTNRSIRSAAHRSRRAWSLFESLWSGVRLPGVASINMQCAQFTQSPNQRRHHHNRGPRVSVQGVCGSQTPAINTCSLYACAREVARRGSARVEVRASECARWAPSPRARRFLGRDVMHCAEISTISCADCLKSSGHAGGCPLAACCSGWHDLCDNARACQLPWPCLGSHHWR
jgi:hypothetical protein